jgi:hypothetical protein
MLKLEVGESSLGGRHGGPQEPEGLEPIKGDWNCAPGVASGDRDGDVKRRAAGMGRDCRSADGPCTGLASTLLHAGPKVRRAPARVGVTTVQAIDLQALAVGNKSESSS